MATIPQPSPSDIARFWAQVDCSGGPAACWPWTGYRTNRGYGMFGFQKHRMQAHRFALWMDKRLVPELCVCHSCDVPACCNPAHLWLGTIGENTRDAAAKGRMPTAERNGHATRPDRTPRGEATHAAKLTEDTVREIRALYATGTIGYRRLSKRYGITETAVTKIVKRQSWKHI